MSSKGWCLQEVPVTCGKLSFPPPWKKPIKQLNVFVIRTFVLQTTEEVQRDWIGFKAFQTFTIVNSDNESDLRQRLSWCGHDYPHNEKRQGKRTKHMKKGKSEERIWTLHTAASDLWGVFGVCSWMNVGRRSAGSCVPALANRDTCFCRQMLLLNFKKTNFQPFKRHKRNYISPHCVGLSRESLEEAFF